ncbi:MAG: DUF5602 domain-containing protein [Chitinophagaceae bacterium]|nr:DUF5602 domain-containing protein [Chitinophagaceae bacterium]
MKKHLLMAVVTATVLMASCNKDDDNENGEDIVFGTETVVGQGKAVSFLKNANDHGKMELGFTFDMAALQGLPDHGEINFLLNLPKEALDLTPYKHISFDWAPHGHDPSGVYDKPHFDIHFYTISRDEQNAITVANPDMQKLPDASFLPKQYVPEPGGIDKMGKHWLDITSPELNPVNPAPFTSTLIYGTYNSKVIFLEPMVTREFFLTKPDTIINVQQPDSFAVRSHYPMRYKMKFDQASNKITVALIDFEHR